MPRRPPPAAPGEYIVTSATGNKISRRAAIYGATNIVLGGKCTIHARALIRGDLSRIVRVASADGDARAEAGAASSVVIVMGRYGCVDVGAVLRPPAKTYQGCVCVRGLTQPVFLLSVAHRRPRLHRRRYHRRGRTDRQLCAHRRAVCHRTLCLLALTQGRFSIIRDCAVVLDGAVLAPHTVVPSMCVYGGSPATFVAALPESFQEVREHESRTYYYAFRPPPAVRR